MEPIVKSNEKIKLGLSQSGSSSQTDSYSMQRHHYMPTPMSPVALDRYERAFADKGNLKCSTTLQKFLYLQKKHFYFVSFKQSSKIFVSIS